MQGPIIQSEQVLDLHPIKQTEGYGSDERELCEADMIRIIFSRVHVLEFSHKWHLGFIRNLKSEAETINQFKIIRKPAQFHTRYSCGCLHEAAMDWSMHACGHLKFQLRLLIRFFR
jgi:hypothetical protein